MSTLKFFDKDTVPQKCYSIGFMRDDGDFALLATLNNMDGNMSDDDFESIKQKLMISFSTVIDEEIICLERQDAPDYVELDSE